MSQLTARRVISGDPEALAALANIHVDITSVPLPPQPLLAPASLTSGPSANSTPNVDSTDTDTPRSSSDGRDSQEGLGGPWRDLHPRPPTSLSETTAATSVQSELDSQSSCCCAPRQNDVEADIKHDVKTPRYFEQPQNLAVTGSYQANGLTQPTEPVQNLNKFNMQHQHDLAQLNTDFSTYELSAGCGMVQNCESIQEPQRSQVACECGDDCECFACMQHPKNRKTLGYVRYHNDLFMREAQFPQLGFGDNQLDYQLTMDMPHTQQFMSAFGSSPVIGDQPVPWPHSTEPGMPNAPNQYTREQFHFQAGSQALSSNPTSNPESAYMSPAGHFTPTFAPGPVPAQHSPVQPMRRPSSGQPAPDTDAQADDGTSSTLSPSAFMLHEYTLPGCDNVYGTCLCGDGCSCDGCLTHSGHQGFGTTNSADAAVSDGGHMAAAMTGVAANGWNGLYSDHGGTDHPGETG
jgi:hypothetical protein